MDRTERLLDLVALLLDAREPVSWAELREHFPKDYGQGSDEANERKFERDKAELLELGIPISYVTGDDDRKDGYVVEPEAYYLPEVDLTPAELAVLYAAGSAALTSGAFPGHQDLAHALRKVGFIAGGELAHPKVRLELGGAKVGPELSSRLEALWTASSSRKRVQITYFSPHANKVTERAVDPYGLAMRQGLWTLVGHCHLRKGIRTFHVHRIRDLSVNTAKPRSTDFDVPADFNIDAYVASHPWEHRLNDPVDVMLELRGALAPLAERLFPRSQTHQEAPERTEVTVRATYLDGLIRVALSLGKDCRVLAPDTAVARWRSALETVAARHARPLEGVLV